jgi:hypothetical protein
MRQPVLSRGSRRIVNAALLAVAGVFLALLVMDVAVYVRLGDHSLIGQDLTLYRDATRRLLDGGSFYLPHQLAGLYEITNGDVLYPPTAIPLFAAFLVAPAPLWWAVPCLGIAAVFLWSRPSAAVIAVTAICLWFPATPYRIITGNPVMWAALCVALAGRWPVFGPWALIKPSLFPFALVGASSRRWWASLVVFVAILGLLLPLTLQWLTVVLNSRNPGGWLYSLQDVPLMLIGVLAWVSRIGMSARSRSPTTTEDGAVSNHRAESVP